MQHKYYTPESRDEPKNGSCDAIPFDGLPQPAQDDADNCKIAAMTNAWR